MWVGSPKNMVGKHLRQKCRYLLQILQKINFIFVIRAFWYSFSCDGYRLIHGTDVPGERHYHRLGMVGYACVAFVMDGQLHSSQILVVEYARQNFDFRCECL